MNQGSQDEFRDSFFEECEELLEAMQDGFNQLQDDYHDSETLNAIFRAVHSIKGGAGAFRLNNLVAFAHHFETGLDKLRSGEVNADDEMLVLLRQSGDHLSDLTEASRADDDATIDGTEDIMDRLTEVFSLSPDAEEEEPDFEPVTLSIAPLGGAAPMEPIPAADEDTEAPGFDIVFSAAPGLFQSGNDPIILFRALERFGPLSVEIDLSTIPQLDDFDPGICYPTWTLRIETDAPEADLREVFEFVEDQCSLSITAFPTAGPALPDLATFAALPETAPPALPTLDDVIAAAPTPAADPAPAPKDTDAAPGKSPSAKKSGAEDRKPETAQPAQTSQASQTIRVDLEKVDKMINLVGELVIKEAMLSQSVSKVDLPSGNEVLVGLDNLKQLAAEIQEGVMSIRAQPVKPLIQRMSRIVRESATATGKQVRLVTEGENTEVDKTVVERLVDPLTHMIRNAVDHGLEDTETRRAAGKPEEGTITLIAAHRSGRVVIEISDDGSGINRERVKQLAIERDLVPEGADLSPSEIDNLLFLPGFSSKDEVSELSGRGVGLDVVRSEITRLGGRVSIQSHPGEGTTFTISLPLTLAVLEGMVIKVAGQTLVVPISAVQETLQPKGAEIDTIGQNERVLRNRKGLVPIIDLGSCLGYRSGSQNLDKGVLLLIETADHQNFALVVDEIQDQRQVVIKSLETNYQQIEGVAAATILGDGRIALIVDTDGIISTTRAGAFAQGRLNDIGAT